MKPNSPRLGPAPLLALVLVVGQGVEFSMIHHIDSYCSYAFTEIWVVSSHLLMNVADAYAVQYFIVQILIIKITNICIYIYYIHIDFPFLHKMIVPFWLILSWNGSRPSSMHLHHPYHVSCA